VKRVVIAEKPSVARSLADALGGYRRQGDCYRKGDSYITWAIGHLVELKMPHEYDPSLKRWTFDNLPFAPAVLRLKVIHNRKDRFEAVRKILDGAEMLVNACDAGREGELIFRRIIRQVGYKGESCRLWISSYTDEAIRAGFRDLRPSEQYNGLHESARVRSEGDWIVGLNGTRALTVRHGGGVLLSVGRVQTPVLAGIVAREMAIRNFVPEPYWLLEATFTLKSKEKYEGMWFRPEQLSQEEAEQKALSKDRSEGQKVRKDKTKRDKKDKKQVSRSSWIASLEQAKVIEGRVKGQTGTVIEAKTKTRREAPPQLFDLTSLQRFAHARYRMSAKQTLSVAQALYEKHKLITYPRTDSRYITQDLVSSLKARLKALQSTSLRSHADVLIHQNLSPGTRVVNGKKVTDHHALLPTPIDSSRRNLSQQESNIYLLIARQLVAALFPHAIWLDTRVVTAVGRENPDHFLTRGRILKSPGWRAVIPPRSSDKILPALESGLVSKVSKTKVREEETKAPPRYTEGTLLRFMETAGKAIDDDEMREAMKDHGLGTPATRADIIEKLKHHKYIAQQGQSLTATALGEMLISLIPVEEIKSPEMTGQWEKRIHEIQRERYDASHFKEEIVGLTDRLITAIRGAASQISEVDKVAPEELKRWKKKGSRRGSSGGRSSAPNSKASYGQKGSPGSRKTGPSAASKKPKKPKKKAVKLNRGDPLGPCPRCRRGSVILGQKDFGCHRWRDGCRFILRRQAVPGRTLTEHQVKGLLSKGHTRALTIKSGSGSYKGRLKLQGEKVIIERL
jgi:DNA topoisomerase III